MNKKLIVSILLIISSLAEAKSVARQWNEMMLSAIRKDYARPTVAARNLYSLSMITYDGWAMYEPNAKNFYYTDKVESANKEKDQKTTISVAAHKLIMHRFQKSPNFEKIKTEANQLLVDLQIKLEVASPELLDPAVELGQSFGDMIINLGQYDGSLEDKDYETPADIYIPLNPPVIIKNGGVGKIKDVNFWQPLALDMIVDQGGNPLPSKIQQPLTLHWGQVKTFALTDKERNLKNNLYFDPGMPPLWNGVGHEQFVKSMVQVIEYSSWLDSADNVKLDISPNGRGNNKIGRNDGKGYVINPVTQKAYVSEVVSRGDYARVLAEFWADGPQSETPPGHWNVVANKVSDDARLKKQWMAQGQVLSDLEWDVKMYLTLNGALHDTAVTVWGIKGYYQASRPISAIRYLGSLGQSSNPELPSYNALGFPLVDNLIELITNENTQPGEKLANLVGHEGQIAIRAWKGSPGAAVVNKGVGWILAENWVPYQKPTFVTPPFPGYVSGHSTYSRTAAEVLTVITGSPYFPGGLGEYTFKANQYLSFEKGPAADLTLQWATYYDAADESAISRIYGGIHGNIDDIPGRMIGQKIGRKAVAKANSIFNP